MRGEAKSPAIISSVLVVQVQALRVGFRVSEKEDGGISLGLKLGHGATPITVPPDDPSLREEFSQASEDVSFSPS